MGNLRVLLPTRRSVNELRRLFIENSGNNPVLLPAIQAIGDLDYDDILPLDTDLSLLSTYKNSLKPVPSSKYKLMLLKKMAEAQNISNTKQAVNLAQELNIFLAEVEENKLDLHDLTPEDSEDLAIHWQKTLGFLKKFGLDWKQFLEENNMTSAASHIISNIDLQVKAYEKIAPPSPIIIAGCYHMIKSVINLVSTLTKYDNTYLLFRGLENTLSEKEFDNLDETHSHFCFKQLFKKLHENGLPHALNFKKIPTLRYEDCEIHDEVTASTLYNSLLPQELTHSWHSRTATPLKHVDYLECATSWEELQLVLFYILHQVGCDGLKNIAVVTDRDGASKMELLLKQWNLPYNNTYGNSYLSSEVVKYFLLLLDVYIENYPKDKFLTILKHQFSHFGYRKEELEEQTRLFEKYVLNDRINRHGMDSYRENLKKIENDAVRKQITSFLDNVESYYAPLTGDSWDLKELLLLHLKLFDAITEDRITAAMGKNSTNSDESVNSINRSIETTSQDNEKNSNPWLINESNRKIAEFFHKNLLEQVEDFGSVTLENYGDILLYLLADRSYSENYSTYPAVNLISPEETQLITYDLVIIMNLNEGFLPKATRADPWMSRNIRKKFGLPPREGEIARQSYEFLQLLLQPKVLLTRSREGNGVDNVKSRFLQRLEIFLACHNIKLQQPEGIERAFRNYFSLDLLRPASAQLQKNAKVKKEAKYDPMENCEKNSSVDFGKDGNNMHSTADNLTNYYTTRPNPKPPLEVRPQKLSATEIDLLNTNPYDIYAKKTLGLRKQNILSDEIGADKIGTAIHRIFEEYCKNYDEYHRKYRIKCEEGVGGEYDHHDDGNEYNGECGHEYDQHTVVENLVKSLLADCFSGDEVLLKFYGDRIVKMTEDFIAQDGQSRNAGYKILTESYETYDMGYDVNYARADVGHDVAAMLNMIKVDNTHDIFTNNFQDEHGDRIEHEGIIERGKRAFQISARIDRIELSSDNIRIVDYKTGNMPSRMDVLNGHQLQLLVELLILSQKFKDRNVSSLQYWGINPREIKITRLDSDVKNTKEINPKKITGNSSTKGVNLNEITRKTEKFLKMLLGFFASEDRGYVATARNRTYSDFDHLARFDEWL